MKKWVITFLLVALTSFPLKAVLPQEVLKDNEEGANLNGCFVRKGSIAVTLANAQEFNTISKLADSNEKSAKLKQLIKDVNSVIPGLHSLGVFDFFLPIQWIKSQNAGKVFIGLLYLQQHPEKRDSQIDLYLKELLKNTTNDLKPQIELVLFQDSCSSNM